MILFLIGYMGCGKSSIGRELARRTGFAFVDMDREVERECGGRTVSQIFEQEGEAFFRACERKTLERLCTGERMIVATGGGVPCFGDNMEVMNAAGRTVYFKMTPPKLAQRLHHGRDKRPILRGMDDEQLLRFIERNLREREPFYSQASMVIDCDGVSDDYICNHVRMYIEKYETK